jgi:hypothetical protein
VAIVARRTLDRAHFFLGQAAEAGAGNRVAFQHYLESAIVFARSVTFHLQKQYAHTTGFDEWYAPWQEKFKNDPLARFFTEQRNYSLKVGPLAVRKHVDIRASVTIRLSVTATGVVIRGQPWYRRSVRILVEDLLAPMRSRVSAWSAERRRRALPPPPQSEERTVVTESLRFMSAPGADRPALELLREHLTSLGELVDEAQARFGAAPPEAV